MTTPWRSVQDAEKANETVAWQALPCRLSGGRVSKHRKLALACHPTVCGDVAQNEDERAVSEDVGLSPSI
jgi:hypothetical protein